MNTHSMNTTWDYLRQEGNYSGHKFWRNQQGQIAITDYSLKVSGRPETTDDGLLFVDTTQPVRRIEGGSPVIPLLSPQGNKFFTPATEGDIQFCLTKLGMTSVIPPPQPRRRYWA
jgi:hypothetical protein